MSFPIEHVGVISKNFGDARSLVKLAKKVAETQLKCQQLNGAATSQVVVGGDKFAVVPRGSVKLSQPLLVSPPRAPHTHTQSPHTHTHGVSLGFGWKEPPAPC